MPATHHARASVHGSFSNADRYDRIANHLTRGLHARVVADISAAGLADGSRVLDAGTGPGRLPIAIAQASSGLRIEGLDQSPNMIERARHNATAASLAHRLTFAVGDVADLPYPDDSFDLVVSSASQHHWADVPAGLRELRRVVHPAGRIWIYDIRFALGRAEVAARTAFPGYAIRREPVRTNRLPIRLISRLTIEPS